MERETPSSSSQNNGKSERKKRGIICVAFGCSNTTKNGVKLHKFPWSRNTKLAREWERIVATRRAHWKATKWSHICSSHFTGESFTSSSKIRRTFDPSYPLVLEHDAVPTIFYTPTSVTPGPSQQDSESDTTDSRQSRLTERPVKRRKVGGTFRKRERAKVTRGNKAVENQNKKDNISFGARPRLILPKISQKKLSLSPTQGLMTRDSEGQHCSGSESEGSLRAPESQGSLVVSGKHKKKSGFVNQGLTLVTDSTLPLQNDVDQENGSDCTGLEIFSVTGITEERQDFSHLCSDQDIPVEESNLKTTNDNLPIPKEIKVTNQRDNLQEEFFSTDCNGLTERGTINNQSSGTHTYGKRKRRKSESYKEPEALLGNDEDFVKTCNDQIEADSCDAFGRYIALQLKQLPIENALNLQMVIHKLVAEERLKVQQKEVRMKKRVVKRKGTVDSAFGIHSSVKESSTNEFYADNSTRRGQTWVKYNVVNDKSNDRSNSLKKSSKIEWHNKDSIQVKAPKKSTIFGDMERLPIKKSNEESNIHSSSAEDSLAMTATVMRQPDTFSEDSPGMAAAAEEPPDEVYNFENQSLLNITIDKQGFEDDDDCNYWDAPSPISVKSEAESISSG